MKKSSDIIEYSKRRTQLMSQGRFDELRAHVESMFGIDSDEIHALECEILWRQGNRKAAIEEIIHILKLNSYSISHIILASEYVFIEKDMYNSQFLKNEFRSKYEEVSSNRLISYVYKRLRGIEPSLEESETARLFF